MALSQIILDFMDSGSWNRLEAFVLCGIQERALCKHVRTHEKPFLVSCCGIFDSNYFQAVHHKISIKIVSNGMTQFSVGLILFKKKKKKILGRWCFYFPWINNETLSSIWQSRQQKWAPANSDKRVRCRTNICCLTSGSSARSQLSIPPLQTLELFTSS